MHEDEDRDNDVGYQRPPLHSRFQPGQSGNPKGRPKKTKVQKTILEKMLKELNQTVNIRENGKTINVTKLEAAIKSVTAKALQGDAKSMALLFKIMPQLEEIQESAPKHLIISWKE